MKSDNAKKGVDRAPNRSLFYALGLTEEEISRPLIGVVSSYNEIVPGHMHLDKISQAVMAGVRAAGGTPIQFPAIAVCDGIAMGHIGMKYSLVTRDLIADSTEAMAIAHQFDGLVMVPNCDKNVPGLLMAAARINVPTIFCAGGPMLAGRLPDGRRTCLSHMFEAVGAYHAGTLDEEGVKTYVEQACPSCGSCSGMYTANSMNCLTEAIGMALKGNGTIPAPYSARIRLAKATGMQIMKLVEKDIKPRDIMTEAAFHNAETVDMALGCYGKRDQQQDSESLPPGSCGRYLYGRSRSSRRSVCRDEGAHKGRPSRYVCNDSKRQYYGREHRKCRESQQGYHQTIR